MSYKHHRIDKDITVSCVSTYYMNGYLKARINLDLKSNYIDKIKKLIFDKDKKNNRRYIRFYGQDFKISVIYLKRFNVLTIAIDKYSEKRKDIMSLKTKDDCVNYISHLMEL